MFCLDENAMCVTLENIYECLLHHLTLSVGTKIVSIAAFLFFLLSRNGMKGWPAKPKSMLEPVSSKAMQM